MLRIRYALAALALMAPAAVGQTPAEELAELERRRDESEASYTEKYEQFRPAFEAFAKRHAGTEEALTARLWLLQQCWWLRSDSKAKMESTAKELADAILAEYPRSQQLALVAEYSYVFSAKDRAAILERLRESPHEAVQATALYYLAKRAKDKEREALYRELAKVYGKLGYRYTTFGELADAALAPHPPAALKIGQPAPDIAGVDVDGNAMRLSDYRGKVVVLDFWGHW